ncbi:unnamed protein product [Rhizophagus irregularis]|nr:unnamed protein product [Rhizophagus irregularis]
MITTYLSQSSQLLPSLRSSQATVSISLSTFFVTATFSIPLVPIPLVTTTVSIPSSQQQSPYPSSQQQSPYSSSQQQLPYPSTLCHDAPEHLHDQIEQMIHRGKRSSEERSRTSSSSTPIMTTPTLTRTDSMDTLEEIPLITQSSTSTSSLGIAIPSVTSSTLPRMNPMDDMEEELLSSGLQLPKFYLKNRRYPTSIRPYANSPEKFTDRDTNISYNQKRISNIISLQNSIPKWLRIIVINELKSLFLRTRNLDKSNNNQIIEDFLASLLPTFMNDHPDILHNVAKSFRKPGRTGEIHYGITSSLDTKLIKNVKKKTKVLISSQIYNSDARDHFFTHTGNLYTVNNIFNNLSGYNIGSSIDLSKYEIENNDDDDSNSSSEDEPKPKSKEIY